MNNLLLASGLLDAFVDMIEPAFNRVTQRSRCVAVIESEEIALFEVSKGVSKLVARTGSMTAEPKWVRRKYRGRDVELRLRADQVLHRTVRFPKAGQAFIGQIIEHRLDRLIPWRPDKALYGFRILEDAAPDGFMTVEVAATSQDIATEATRRLEAFGLVATSIGTAAEAITTPVSIDLYRGRRSAVRSRVRHYTAFMLAVLSVVIPAACLSSFWVLYDGKQQLQLVESNVSRARSVSQGTSRASEARGRDRALIEAKRQDTSFIMLINRLSRALPANTFLRELEIDSEKVRLVGSSSDAPALVSILEAETLTNVRFAAPVTRDDTKRDNFEILATRGSPVPFDRVQ
jgi:general secretion pathway protein L